jgi:acetoin utilization protein AcuB
MMPIARQLMTENPTAVGATARVSEALQVFQALDVRHLPVVNEQRELVGMLSDRDLRSLALPHLIDGEWMGTVQTALDARVATLMSNAPLSVDAETEVAEIVDLMLDQSVGAVPVVDAENHLVGIVSYVDLLRELCSAAPGGA